MFYFSLIYILLSLIFRPKQVKDLYLQSTFRRNSLSDSIEENVRFTRPSSPSPMRPPSPNSSNMRFASPSIKNGINNRFVSPLKGRDTKPDKTYDSQNKSSSNSRVWRF